MHKIQSSDACLRNERAMPDFKKPSSLSLSMSRLSKRSQTRPDTQEALETQWPLLESRSSRFMDQAVPALNPAERDARREMKSRRAPEPASKVSPPRMGERLSRVLSHFVGRAQEENNAANAQSPKTPTKRPARRRPATSSGPTFAAPSLSKLPGSAKASAPQIEETTRSIGPRGRSTGHPQESGSAGQSIQQMFSRLVRGKEASKPEPAKTPSHPLRRK